MKDKCVMHYLFTGPAHRWEFVYSVKIAPPPLIMMLPIKHYIIMQYLFSSRMICQNWQLFCEHQGSKYVIIIIIRNFHKRKGTHYCMYGKIVDITEIKISDKSTDEEPLIYICCSIYKKIRVGQTQTLALKDVRGGGVVF